MREPARLAWRLRSDPLRFREIRDRISLATSGAGLGDGEARGLAIAVSETCANVYRHAYSGRRDGWIDLAVEVSERRIVVTVRHRGLPFDPRRYVPPDLTRPAERGYGIYLISRLVSSVTFAEDADGARIVLVKELAGAVAEAASRGEE